MKAVLCAAGVGSRMRPFTLDRPKGLLPLGGKLLIEHILDGVSACGIRDVIVIIGHYAEKVREALGENYRNCRITYVENPEYATTQNIYSLWLARGEVTDGMIFMNADTVFHPMILKMLVESPYENAFAMSAPIEILEDSMKVHLVGDKLLQIGKEIAYEPHGEAFGIYKLSQEGSEKYFSIAGNLFQSDEHHKTVPFVEPLQIMAETMPIRAVSSNGYPWVEIDTPEDYERAQKIIGRISTPSSTGWLVKNYTAVATSPEKHSLLKWFEAGMRSVLPSSLMRENIRISGDTLFVQNRPFPLANRRIFVIGAGKAAPGMAKAIEDVLGPERITAGIIVSNESTVRPHSIEVHEADHPLPSERSVTGSRKILDLKTKYDVGEKDLVIALISGGGSSLLAHPASGVTLSDKQKMIELLIRSGANVHEMTVLKKKISSVKGGRLAQHFYPTQIISLILSDVVGNDLTVIASGPLVYDETTIDDVFHIIDAYDLRPALPKSITEFFESRAEKEENVLPFGHVSHALLGDNDTALRAIKTAAENDGVRVHVQSHIEGEAGEVARAICADISKRKIRKPTLFLYGGETTVKLPKIHGVGGRNQEFVLSCLEYLRANPLTAPWALASLGTDGVDFIPEAAGALADSGTIERADEKGIDFAHALATHDSYPVLRDLGAIVSTGGPTGTNVGDVMMIFVDGSRTHE